MLDEKEFNEQGSFEVNSASNGVNNNVVTNNVNGNVDANHLNSLQNAFLYMDSPSYSSVETPIETLDIIEQADYDIAQELNSSNEDEELIVNENINQEVFENNDIETIDTSVSEVPVISNEQPILEEKDNEDEIHEIVDNDLKSNLIFMGVVVIVILVAIFALPYISGYN